MNPPANGPYRPHQDWSSEQFKSKIHPVFSHYQDESKNQLLLRDNENSGPLLDGPEQRKTHISSKIWRVSLQENPYYLLSCWFFWYGWWWWSYQFFFFLQTESIILYENRQRGDFWTDFLEISASLSTWCKYRDKWKQNNKVFFI